MSLIATIVPNARHMSAGHPVFRWPLKVCGTFGPRGRNAIPTRRRTA
jgi:hypothetical protein